MKKIKYFVVVGVWAMMLLLVFIIGCKIFKPDELWSAVVVLVLSGVGLVCFLVIVMIVTIDIWRS